MRLFYTPTQPASASGCSRRRRRRRQTRDPSFVFVFDNTPERRYTSQTIRRLMEHRFYATRTNCVRHVGYRRVRD